MSDLYRASFQGNPPARPPMMVATLVVAVAVVTTVAAGAVLWRALDRPPPAKQVPAPIPDPGTGRR